MGALAASIVRLPSWQELEVQDDLHLADFSHLDDHRFRNSQMLKRGAELCLILHHSDFDEGSRDLAMQAIEAGIPTCLIDSDAATPRRLSLKDPRLK